MRECDPQANPFAGVFAAIAVWMEQRFRCGKKGETGGATAQLSGFLTYQREPSGNLSQEASAIPRH
jgi:hypothetical protein